MEGTGKQVSYNSVLEQSYTQVPQGIEKEVTTVTKGPGEASFTEGMTLMDEWMKSREDS